MDVESAGICIEVVSAGICIDVESAGFCIVVSAPVVGVLDESTAGFSVSPFEVTGCPWSGRVFAESPGPLSVVSRAPAL